MMLSCAPTIQSNKITARVKNDEYIIGNSTSIKNQYPLSSPSCAEPHNNPRLLDTYTASNYNVFRAEVAQSVEQRTENPRVPSSILGLGTKIRAEVVQR